eukprot:9228688-Lingulodinium_polyedra.AAC.1
MPPTKARAHPRLRRRPRGPPRPKAGRGPKRLHRRAPMAKRARDQLPVTPTARPTVVPKAPR